MNTDKIIRNLGIYLMPFTYNGRPLPNIEVAEQITQVRWLSGDKLREISKTKPCSVFTGVDIALQLGFTDIEERLAQQGLDEFMEANVRIGLIGIPSNGRAEFLFHPFSTDQRDNMEALMKELPENYDGKTIVVVTTWFWHNEAKFSPSNGVIVAHHDVYFVK